MFQPDLFPADEAGPSHGKLPERPLDLPGILDRLTELCERPRYTFMVLNLIAQVSAGTGRAGPFVYDGSQRTPIRDWLSDALTPVARRDPRRLGIFTKVRREFQESGALLGENAQGAEQMIDAEVRRRIRLSGRTNVSRAVSELVRAGMVRRHYQGYRVDHHNRGAQRHAVYEVTDETRRALSSGR